jgi:hypothetical protein
MHVSYIANKPGFAQYQIGRKLIDASHGFQMEMRLK